MEKSEKSLEFEDYLLSIGGLVNGWFPDRDPILSRYFFEVGDGWLDMIKNLIEELIQVGWNKEIKQVKEKFGSLRFYVSEGSDRIFNIIEEYEDLSENTCEICSSVNNVVTFGDGGWLRTLCEEHKCKQESL